MTIAWDGEEYPGEYEGDVVDGLPEGTGSFSYKEDEDYLEYEGGWKAGAMAGEGSLESNVITIHFNDVDRIGTYKGDVLDGMPSGEGEFSAKNDEGVAYSYNGSWKNGVFHGQGKEKFEAEDYYNHIGTFTNGEFTPTPAEVFVSNGTLDLQPYTMSTATKNYINEYEDIFTKNSKENLDDLIDDSFTYQKYSKNPAAYEPGIIKIKKLKVIQIQEGMAWGYEYTFAILLDSNNHVYSVDLLNRAENIYEGDTVTLYALPPDFFTYRNMQDDAVWAIACAGVCLEK